MTAKVPRLGSHITPWVLQPDSLCPLGIQSSSFHLQKEHPNWGSRCPLRTDLTESHLYQNYHWLVRLGYFLTLCFASGSVFPCSSVSLMLLSTAKLPPSQAREGQREEGAEPESLTPTVPWHTSVFSLFIQGLFKPNKYFLA